MNIIWKQECGLIAVTSIFDGSDPAIHAKELKERGDIPAEWECVSSNYLGLFPEVDQELWRWGDGVVYSVDKPVVQEQTPLEKLQAFLSENPDVAAEL